MSKVLSVENGNYIVKVESGKNIILDTSRGEIDSNGDLDTPFNRHLASKKKTIV